MIVGVGVDLVAVERIADLLQRYGERARRRLFSGRELAECDGRADRAECLAARFAAKEATLKALGTGKTPDVRWTEIEVVSGAAGRPALRLSGRALGYADQLGTGQALVSLSHEKGMAVAMVVLQTEPTAG